MPLSGKRKVAVVFWRWVDCSVCMHWAKVCVSDAENAIGGGDAMTMIVLQNSSPVNSSEIFGGLAVICMVALVFLLRKRKNKERNIKK